MYIERVLDEMKMLRIPNPRKFVPCTEQEVARLEETTHLSLPLAYREFLLTMGNGTDTLLRGSDFLYPQLMNLQKIAREMLIEDNFPQPLPEDAFVFFMHQGYQFYFFCTSAGDNPPVYRYVEERDRETFPCAFPHFTDFLLISLREHAASIQRRRNLSSKNADTI